MYKLSALSLLVQNECRSLKKISVTKLKLKITTLKQICLFVQVVFQQVYFTKYRPVLSILCTGSFPGGVLQYCVLDDGSASRCWPLLPFPVSRGSDLSGGSESGSADRSRLHLSAGQFTCSPVWPHRQVCSPVWPHRQVCSPCLFPAGGDVCRSGHSDPCSVVLGVLRQFRHHPLVPAVDVLHLLRQVGALCV